MPCIHLVFTTLYIYIILKRCARSLYRVTCKPRCWLSVSLKKLSLTASRVLKECGQGARQRGIRSKTPPGSQTQTPRPRSRAFRGRLSHEF